MVAKKYFSFRITTVIYRMVPQRKLKSQTDTGMIFVSEAGLIQVLVSDQKQSFPPLKCHLHIKSLSLYH